MKLFSPLVTFCLGLCLCLAACAHPGGTKRKGPLEGCHNDRKRGGFHCHSGSQYNGQSWSNEEEALKSIQGTAVAPSKPPLENISRSSRYIRKDWNYPRDEDGDCQNTRAEILIERTKKPVTFTNKRLCTVATGEWEDFYFPETITSARLIQIDHVVPLKNAHESGGADWSEEMKTKFANDPENLVITSSKTNQQKGAKGIESWVPINKERACRYLKLWTQIKTKYSLKISNTEAEAVSRQTCR